VSCLLQLTGDALIRRGDRPGTVPGPLDGIFKLVRQHTVRAAPLRRARGVIDGRGEQRVSEADDSLGTDGGDLGVRGRFKGLANQVRLDHSVQLRHGDAPSGGHEQANTARALVPQLLGALA